MSSDAEINDETRTEGYTAAAARSRSGRRPASPRASAAALAPTFDPVARHGADARGRGAVAQATEDE
jgi:hypothetical protein